MAFFEAKVWENVQISQKRPLGFVHEKDTSPQSQPVSGIKGRKPGVCPRFPCSGKAGFMSRLLHLPAPRAKSGKALWVPGKAFLKYREFNWQVPLYVIWRMSSVFEREPLLCQRQSSGQNQQRGFSEPETHMCPHSLVDGTDEEVQTAGQRSRQQALSNSAAPSLGPHRLGGRDPISRCWDLEELKAPLLSPPQTTGCDMWTFPQWNKENR